MRSTNQFYTGSEYHFRFGIYLQDLKFVQTHNSNPTKSFKVKMNHFATLTPSEYKQMLGFKPNPASYLKNQNPQKIFTKKRKQSDWFLRYELLIHLRINMHVVHVEHSVQSKQSNQATPFLLEIFFLYLNKILLIMLFYVMVVMVDWWLMLIIM